LYNEDTNLLLFHIYTKAPAFEKTVKLLKAMTRELKSIVTLSYCAKEKALYDFS